MYLEGTHPPVRQLAHDDCGNDKLERQGCYTRSCQFRFGPHFGWAFQLKYFGRFGILAKYFGVTFWKKYK